MTTTTRDLDRVERSIEVAAGVERVWQILTDPEALRQWYAFDGATVELEVGGRLTFSWAEHGLYVARVLEVDPPRVLRYLQSHVPDAEPTPASSTTVTFTVDPLPLGCRVSVVETGLDALDPELVGAGFHAVQVEGWSEAFALLEVQCASGARR